MADEVTPNPEPPPEPIEQPVVPALARKPKPKARPGAAALAREVWRSFFVVLAVLLVFLIAAFFLGRSMSTVQYWIVAFVCAIIAMIAVRFLGGTISAQHEVPDTLGGKIAVKATGPPAAFIWTLLVFLVLTPRTHSLTGMIKMKVGDGESAVTGRVRADKPFAASIPIGADGSFTLPDVSGAQRIGITEGSYPEQFLPIQEDGKTYYLPSRAAPKSGTVHAESLEAIGVASARHYRVTFVVPAPPDPAYTGVTAYVKSDDGASISVGELNLGVDGSFMKKLPSQSSDGLKVEISSDRPLAKESLRLEYTYNKFD